MMLAPATVWATHPLEVEDTGTEGKGNFLFELTGNFIKDDNFKTTKLTGIFTGMRQQCFSCERGL
jgi:hypothetical protein